MSERAIREIRPCELQPLRGVLEQVGRELAGRVRVRVAGMTYRVRTPHASQPPHPVVTRGASGPLHSDPAEPR